MRIGNMAAIPANTSSWRRSPNWRGAIQRPAHRRSPGSDAGPLDPTQVSAFGSVPPHKDFPVGEDPHPTTRERDSAGMSCHAGLDPASMLASLFGPGSG